MRCIRASFPQLTHVAGDLYVQGGPEGLDCSAFMALSRKGGVGGSFHCGPTRAQPPSSKTHTTSLTAPSTTLIKTTTSAAVTTSSYTASSSATTTTAAIASSGLSASAAGGIGAGVAVGAIALVALLAWCLWERRRRNGRQIQEIAHEAGQRHLPPELLQGRYHEQSQNHVSELTGARKHLYSPVHQASSAPLHHPAEVPPPTPVPMQYAGSRGPVEVGWSTPALEQTRYVSVT